MTSPTLWDVEARRASAFPVTLQQHFDAWLRSEDGIAVYREVIRRARELHRRGWAHFGIAAIWEAIRFDWAIRVGPDLDGFKVNNNFRSRMARRVMEDCPDLADFFEVRELRA